MGEVGGRRRLDRGADAVGEVVDAALQQPLYDARCAGFGYAFASTQQGVLVEASGYCSPAPLGRLLVAVLRRALLVEHTHRLREVSKSVWV